uniref:Uncharacterized protein n=1 Tax=Anopheles minimus TaxID=112268 RepID=A0A182WHD6_9DIPT
MRRSRISDFSVGVDDPADDADGGAGGFRMPFRRRYRTMSGVAPRCEELSSCDRNLLSWAHAPPGIFRCVNLCIPPNGLGTLLCMVELRLTAPVQSYEATCGSTDPAPMSTVTSINPAWFGFGAADWCVSSAEALMSRERNGEKRLVSDASMFGGSGSVAASG